MLYYALCAWNFFVALSAAAMIFGGPESSIHVVYTSATVFAVATVGLIVSAVLAVRHGAAKRGQATTAGSGTEHKQIERGTREHFGTADF